MRGRGSATKGRELEQSMCIGGDGRKDGLREPGEELSGEHLARTGVLSTVARTIRENGKIKHFS